jgi:hypothetical protein
VFNSLPIACTQSSEKHDKLFVFFLGLAEVNKLFDNSWRDTGFEQLGVITEQFLHGGLS